MKKRGQLSIIIIIGILVIFSIITFTYLQSSKDREDFDTLNDPFYDDKVVNTFYQDVAYCLRDLSTRFIEKAGANQNRLDEFLRVSSSVCFNETKFSEIEIKVDLPFFVELTEKPESYLVEVNIATEISKNSVSTLIDTYEFEIDKISDVEEEIEENQTISNQTTSDLINKSDEVVFIDIDEVKFLHKNFTSVAPKTEEIIISYKNITNDTYDYDSLLHELPIIERRFFYSDEELNRYFFKKDLHDVIVSRGFDEIITYNSENISFSEMSELLLRFDFVENVSRTSEYTPSVFKQVYRISNDNNNQNDRYYDYQWYLENNGQFFGSRGADVNINAAWEITNGSKNVTIAVIDQGIAKNQDYDDSILTQKSYNYINNNKDIRPKSIYEYHGTHVTGVIASSVNNNYGIAGICPECSIISMKVFDSGASANTETVIKAAFDSVSNGADIISLSLGGEDYSSYEDTLFARLTNQGIVVVAAAGNEGTSTLTYPAAYKNIISVGATNNRDARAYFSNFGTWVDIYAPGENILSFCGTNTYCFDSGTSMATPIVSGIIGLLLSYNESLTIKEINSLISSTADTLEGNKKRINAGNALIELQRRRNIIEINETELNISKVEEIYDDVIKRRNEWIKRRENVSHEVSNEEISEAFSKADDLPYIVGYCNNHFEECLNYCMENELELFICRLL